MLIDFSFSNFRSFRDEQSFSMTREKRFMESDESLHSPIAAIYGANASGKSNFLKALRAMRNMVVNSYSQGDASSPIPREPFRVFVLYQYLHRHFLPKNMPVLPL